MSDSFVFNHPQFTGIFFICFLFLFLISIWNGVDAFRQKNKKWGIFSFLISLVSFGFEIEVIECAGRFSKWNITVHFVLLIVLSLLLVGLTVQNANTKKKRITPADVKKFGDRLPVGICYWYEGGRVLYFNTCMEAICVELTGKVLMNGDEFYRLVKKDTIHTVGEKTYSFAHSILSVDSRELHELLAFDVTDIRLKNEELMRTNKEIEELNEELRQYSMNMEDAIREQEILQTKINVHDEMNKLLLLSVYSIGETDTEEKRRVLEMWKSSSVLLQGEVMELSSQMIRNEIDELGTMLGLHIVWNGELTDDMSEDARGLFARAAREVIANAVKHGEASELEIEIQKQGEKSVFTFTNNGKIEVTEVSAYGGLLSLKNNVASFGGSFEITTNEKFRIHIII